MNSIHSIKTINYQNFNLFYVGDLSLLDKPKVAIVGSRKASLYSKQITASLSAKLSKHFVIVSGGAIGIDSIAHQNANNNTIMVSPSSLDIIYPKSNKKIIDNIYKNSLIISEYEKNFPPKKYSFVQRNRIVVGISDLVIIVEADKNSGSMRSYEWAEKFEKPVFVLPHRINESSGTNYLLQNNLAKPIWDIDEFCNQFFDIEEIKDEFLEFAKTNPTFEEALSKFGEKVYEYELDGKIIIKDSKVIAI
jgi:DNA processing protein